MKPENINKIWESGYINEAGNHETPKSYSYFQEYLLMGSGRSLTKLHNKLINQNDTETAPVKTNFSFTIKKIFS